LRVAILVFLVLLFLTVNVQAGTNYYVDDANGNDFWDGLSPVWDGTHGPKKTIQAGVNAASNNDTVIVADGTYNGSGNRDINCNKSIIIRSANGKNSCFINCGGEPLDPHRGFFLASGSFGITVEGFSIYSGWENQGGGIYCSTGSCPTIRDCSISSNAAQDGGGIYCTTDSNPTIANCKVSYNRCENGGSGAGIYIYNTIASIGNCEINSNSDAMYGGGIYSKSTNPLSIGSCRIKGNSAFEGGAGIYCKDGTINISKSEIINNSAFTDPSTGCGGGLWLENCVGPSLDECLIKENTVGGLGGGVYLKNTDGITIAHCLILDNQTYENDGGGVYCSGDYNARIINCIIAENNTSCNGAGLYVGNYSNMSIVNSTFAENSASLDGDSIATDSSENNLSIHNTIIWDGNDSIYNAGGSATIINYSNVQGGWLGAGVSNINTDPCFVDPGLKWVPDYENGDYHLMWSSPCINTGDPNFPEDANVYDPYYSQNDIDDEPRKMCSRLDIGSDEVGEKQADFTRDGIIEYLDLNVLVNIWLAVEQDDNWYILCDLYRDNKINFLDFARFAQDWLWQASWYE